LRNDQLNLHAYLSSHSSCDNLNADVSSVLDEVIVQDARLAGLQNKKREGVCVSVEDEQVLIARHGDGIL
jgi:hypothetical protein